MWPRDPFLLLRGVTKNLFWLIQLKPILRGRIINLW